MLYSSCVSRRTGTHSDKCPREEQCGQQSDHLHRRRVSLRGRGNLGRRNSELEASFSVFLREAKLNLTVVSVGRVGSGSLRHENVL
jgi:hypothetical protein